MPARNKTGKPRPGHPSGTAKGKNNQEAKPSSNKRSNTKANSIESTHISCEAQQHVLDIFKRGCEDVFKGHNDLQETIQSVKQNLFGRDFVSAFNSSSARDAYAARWSPTRAICYAGIFLNTPGLCQKMKIGPRLQSKLNADNSTEPVSQGADISPANEETTLGQHFQSLDVAGSGRSQTQIVCVGAGGGAEMVAIAGFLYSCSASIASIEGSKPSLNCTLVDAADWSTTLERLHLSITSSAYDSAINAEQGQANDTPATTPSPLTMNFIQHDVLVPMESLTQDCFRRADVVTIFFTLNELYSSAMGQTTAFLLSLTALLSPGALLLVVDSPGSYSTVRLGKTQTADEKEDRKSDEGTDEAHQEKRYPMHWLLDHTLLEQAKRSHLRRQTTSKAWEKLITIESKWCRLSKELKYPLSLEDMRYQLHLYKSV